MRWPAMSARVGSATPAVIERRGLGAHAGGDRIVVLVLVERADGADGLVEQLDLRREGIAEEAGDAQRDIDARAAELGQRDDLVAGDAPARRLPDRLRADQRQRLGDVVAAGAHVGGAPGGEAKRLRVVAEVLEVAEQQVLGRFLAELPGGRRGHGAVVERNRNCGPSAARPAGRASARRRGRGRRSGPSRPVEQRGDLVAVRRRGASGGCVLSMFASTARLACWRSHSGQRLCRRAVRRRSASSRSTVSPLRAPGVVGQSASSVGLARRSRARPCRR